ncbi:MAG TPA: glycoside hydrolase family 3 protein, partial [Polyangiaceae bacterium]|nr:glycoside hydrolase family 3 protein [Polyangiaceae bacterium]
MPAQTKRPVRAHSALFMFALTLGCAQHGDTTQLSPAVQPAALPASFQCLPPEGPMAAITPSADPDGFPSAACIDRAQGLLAQMSLGEKLGQMMQPDRTLLKDETDLGRYGIGSVLSGGGSAPDDDTPAGWANMVNEFRARSLESRLQIPMMYGIDAVHGHNNVPGAVIFPHNIGLGASRDPDLVERVGRATAEEVAGTDIDWAFSPVLASARDERWGRTYESFGETPELAELLGPALIRGLQGERLGRGPNSVLACAKHFLGDGSTAGGHNAGDDPLTLDQVREQLLPAYQQAISAGVGSIMVSYSSIEGVKMHCHGPLLNDILKGQLGFGGLLVSDWQAIEQLPGDYATQLASSINAGVDMVMNPRRYTGFLSAAAALVPDRIPEARIDDAVTRILTVKCELGMLQPGSFAADSNGSIPTSPELANIGSAAHREIAREAVRKSLVLLKNEAGVLPLSKTIGRVHLAGSHADDLGEQTGGWTISWQGQSGTWTQGTTIRQAFEAALGADHVTYSRDGSGAAGADAAVLVIG